MLAWKSVRLTRTGRSRSNSNAKPYRRSYAAVSWSGSRTDTIAIGTKYRVHVKRDDLLGEAGTGGNKARKLAYFRRTLPETLQKEHYRRIVSTGGNQSNAMLATAHLARDHGLQFDFFSKPLSPGARTEPSGNLAASLKLGMHLHEAQDVDAAIEEYLKSPEGAHSLYIPRGVSCQEAEEGLAELAQEIFEHFRSIAPNKSELYVYLPSGTGTTAHYLHRNLLRLAKGTGVTPFTLGVSIAMRPQDLQASIEKTYPGELGYPLFVHPSKERYRFAEPNPHLKSMWCCLKRKGLEIDLIYAPVAWTVLFEQLPMINHNVAEVYYIHTGGLTGNESQLKRYPDQQCKVTPL